MLLKLLTLFSFISYITYFDRGTFSASRLSVINAFSMSNFQFGVAGGSYLAGFAIASPFFAYYSNIASPFLLIKIGLVIWTLASLFSGLSLDFVSLTIARAFTGIGEASFLCIAPPLIDVFAPKLRRSAWLSLFFCTIPIGFATGYIVSGQWLSALKFGHTWTWRSIFILQSVCMLLLIASFSLIERQDDFMEEIKNKLEIEEGGEISRTKFKDLIKELFKNASYITIILGYAMQTFVVGGFALYGPDYIRVVFTYDIGKATLFFGLITVFAGLGGTAFGGILLDYMRKNASNDLLVCVNDACILVAVLSILVLPLGIVAFSIKSFFMFLTVMFFLEFFLFAQVSPINSIILWVNPLHLRSFAVAVSVIFIHLFGDALSPPFIGALLDKIKCNLSYCNWRLSMLIVSLWLVFPAVLFSISWWLTRNVSTLNNAKTDEKNVTEILEKIDVDEEFINGVYQCDEEKL